MYRLTKDQIDTLVQIILDQSGDNLTRPEFTDGMLKLFEDIGGFEILSAKVERKFVKALWLRYQISCQSK